MRERTHCLLRARILECPQACSRTTVCTISLALSLTLLLTVARSLASSRALAVSLTCGIRERERNVGSSKRETRAGRRCQGHNLSVALMQSCCGLLCEKFSKVSCVLIWYGGLSSEQTLENFSRLSCPRVHKYASTHILVHTHIHVHMYVYMYRSTGFHIHINLHICTH